DPPDPEREDGRADKRAGHDRTNCQRAEPELDEVDRQQQGDKAIAERAHATRRQYTQCIGRGAGRHRSPPLVTGRPSSPHQCTPCCVGAKRRDKMSGPFVTPKAKVTPARISPTVWSLTCAPRSPKSTAILSCTCQIAPIIAERVRNRPTSRS